MAAKSDGPLNLFYEEPDPDRFVSFDRYPRRVLRRLLRGASQPGGQQRVFLNLCAGLDRLEVAYRVNDYRHARQYPGETACIIGKPHVLDAIPWENPIIFGAAVFSHPLDDPDLLERLPVKRVLVPGEWMRRMFEPFYADKVVAWPVGIDTDYWAPLPAGSRDIDVVIYDKIRWRRERYEAELLTPVLDALARRGLSVATIRYGFYKETDFHRLVQRARSMVFLCEHETQGLAYQQALSSGVPILAWDRGGFWQDPEYYPHRVSFGPVSSVPYWDSRCGMTFADFSGFADGFDRFWAAVRAAAFDPRQYILDHLTLEASAQRYVELVSPPSSVPSVPSVSSVSSGKEFLYSR